MTRPRCAPADLRLALGLSLTLVLGAVAPPALAGSSAASVAIESLSTSVGVSSGAISQGSRASSRTVGLAQGDYRVIEMAQAPQADQRLLTLQESTPAAEPVTLRLPAAAVAQARLQTGDVVRVEPRPYGAAFAHAATRQTFFLVLHDDWAQALSLQALVAQP